MDLPELYALGRDAAPYALAILLATTALAHACQHAARAFERYAASTPSKSDDALAARLRRYADSFAGALDFLGAIMPRLSAGRK